jgi:hypothetical protein
MPLGLEKTGRPWHPQQFNSAATPVPEQPDPTAKLTPQDDE